MQLVNSPTLAEESLVRVLLTLCIMICPACSAAEDPPTPKPTEAATSTPSLKPATLPADRASPLRPGSDWSGFLGPTGDNASTETGILTQWPRDGLRKLWERKLGMGYAPPSVHAGKLYCADQVGNKTRLLCLDAQTGAELWTFAYESQYEDLYNYEPGPRCCPVIDDDRVYLHGVEGMLYCVSTKDGKELWKLDTQAKYHFHQNFFGVGSTPIIEGDLLIVAVGGSPPGPRPFDLRDAKANGTAIVALDKRTGAVRYEMGDELASYASPMVATINGKRTGLYFARGGLLGFDPATGKSRFHFPWRARDQESVNAANPVVVGNQILLTECYGVGSALLKVTGDKIEAVWTDRDRDRDERAMLAHWDTPIHEGGYFYGSSGRHTTEADLRCVDLATGEIQWTVRRTTRCTLMKVDGHLLSLSEYGEMRLFKINPKQYEEVARWESPDLDYPVWAPPVLSRGVLYLRGRGKLVAYELIPAK